MFEENFQQKLFFNVTDISPGADHTLACSLEKNKLLNSRCSSKNS